MMAAMMFPSVAPTAALYARTTKQRWPLRPWLFAAGYLLTWAAAGLIAYAIGAAMTTTLGDTPRVGQGRPWTGRRHLDHRRGLRGHAPQGRLPRQVPQPARRTARVVARGQLGRRSDGHEERSLPRGRGSRRDRCPAPGRARRLAPARRRRSGAGRLGTRPGSGGAGRRGPSGAAIRSARPVVASGTRPASDAQPNTHGPEESVVHTAALQRLGYGGRTPTRGEVKGRPSRPCPVAAGAGKLVGVALPCAEPAQKPPERPYRSGGAAQRRRSSGQDRRPTFEGVSSAFAPVEPPVPHSSGLFRLRGCRAWLRSGSPCRVR